MKGLKSKREHEAPSAPYPRKDRSGLMTVILLFLILMAIMFQRAMRQVTIAVMLFIIFSILSYIS